jgi:hypothetical protein
MDNAGSPTRGDGRLTSSELREIVSEWTDGPFDTEARARESLKWELAPFVDCHGSLH